MPQTDNHSAKPKTESDGILGQQPSPHRGKATQDRKDGNERAGKELGDEQA